MNDQEQTTEIALLKQEQKTMSQKLDDVKETVINGFAVIKKDMQDFKNDCNNNYVSKETFNPIKSIVYGMVGFVLLSFIGGLVFLVFK